MKITHLALALGLAFVSTEASAEKLVIKGSDTLGAKLVPQLAEQFKAQHPGTTFDIDFTPDQKYFYVADGSNEKIWIVQRDSLETVGSFGQLGHNAGEFRNVHCVVVDSKGNVYTAEVNEGKRVQKFVPKASRSRS